MRPQPETQYITTDESHAADCGRTQSAPTAHTAHTAVFADHAATRNPDLHETGRTTTINDHTRRQPQADCRPPLRGSDVGDRGVDEVSKHL